MALPKRVIIAILIGSAFITVALILGLIPIYMRSSHKDITTIVTEQTSTTKKIVITMPVDHEEMSEAAMLTVETSYISIESDQVTSTSINPVTTTSTTTSASNTNTTLITTTTTINAINTVPTIASTTTTNTVDSNQIETTTTTTTTALVGSDVPARITITKVLSSSESMINDAIKYQKEPSLYFLAIPSDSAVNGSTESMTSNSDDVSLFTKSISVLTTSGM